MEKVCLKIRFLFVFICCLCFACSDDLLETDSNYPSRTGGPQLTASKAKQLFEVYASKSQIHSRSSSSKKLFDPGVLTPLWKEAMPSAGRENSGVDIPVRTASCYQARRSETGAWVRVSQKLVVVQEDRSLKSSIYLLNIIPDEEYARKYAGDISRQFKNYQKPSTFSGLFVYTDIGGGLPVYISRYQKGNKTDEIYLFDQKYKFGEAIDKINLMLKGYQIGKPILLTRATSETDSSKPGKGEEWLFHTEGDSYQNEDGLSCWDTQDSNGNKYTVADIDGDGRPDTILGNGGNVDSGGGGNGEDFWNIVPGGVNPGQDNNNNNQNTDDNSGNSGEGSGSSGGPGIVVIPPDENPGDLIRPVIVLITGQTNGTAIVVPGKKILEYYRVPLYEVYVNGMDSNKRPALASFLAIRFGVMRYGDGHTGVVGLSQTQKYVVKNYFPDKYYRPNGRMEAGAWQVSGNYLIHDGPDDNSQTMSAFGCIELYGPGAFGEFNRTLLALSGASSEIELAQSGKLTVMYAAAEIPPLTRK